ncbi:AfsR/SARP family transcriptional regulator, partial [Streptomyces polychromogenes]
MRFGLLGQLTVHLDGERRQIAGSKGGVLLATLLLRPNTPQPVDRLMAALWGDHPPRTALASLYNHVTRLRSTLGSASHRLEANQGSYVLRVHVGEVDAEVFAGHLARAQDASRASDWETLGAASRAALALWRGRPLAEYPAFHETPEVTHLVEQHLQAVELDFEYHLRTGRHREVTAEITRYAGAHPLHEPFHRQLITALHQSGRTAEAITAYHALRTTLGDELGVDSSPATQEVFQALLRPDPPQAGTTGTTTPPTPAADRAGTAAGTGPAGEAPFQIPRDIADFTGRAEELSALCAHLTTSGADGMPALVVLSGMGGIGKTTLALHAAHRTRGSFPD